MHGHLWGCGEIVSRREDLRRLKRLRRKGQRANVLLVLPDERTSTTHISVLVPSRANCTILHTLLVRKASGLVAVLSRLSSFSSSPPCRRWPRTARPQGGADECAVDLRRTAAART